MITIKKSCECLFKTKVCDLRDGDTAILDEQPYFGEVVYKVFGDRMVSLSSAETWSQVSQNSMRCHKVDIELCVINSKGE